MQNKINLQENYSENFRSNQNEALGPLQKWWTRFSKCRFLRQNRRRKARPFLQVRKIEIDILNMNWWWKSQKLNHFLTLRYQTWNLLWIHFSSSLLLNFMEIFDVFSSRNVFWIQTSKNTLWFFNTYIFPNQYFDNKRNHLETVRYFYKTIMI